MNSTPGGTEGPEGLEPPSTQPAAGALVRSRELPTHLRDLLRALIALGNFHPGQPAAISCDAIANETGKDPETARRWRNDAEARGLIRVQDRGGGRGRAAVLGIDWAALHALPPRKKPRAKGGGFIADTPGSGAGDSAAEAPRPARGNLNGNPRAGIEKPPRREANTPAPGAGAPYLHKSTTTNHAAPGGGGGGGSIPEGWTEANHAEALAIARGIGHNDPSGFIRRAGTLERVAWLAEQVASADNPAGAAEKRLRAGQTPPEEWARKWRRTRETTRRKSAEQAEQRDQERIQREAILRGLSPEHLAAVVESRAAELEHPAGLNSPDRAAGLRAIHEAGRLFDDDPEARDALAEVMSIGGRLNVFERVIRDAEPRA